ncbi:MAG: hypothetical protein AAF770_04020 [Bacteroidota bacterium]
MIKYVQFDAGKIKPNQQSSPKRKFIRFGLLFHFLNMLLVVAYLSNLNAHQNIVDRYNQRIEREVERERESKLNQVPTNQELMRAIGYSLIVIPKKKLENL